MELVSSLCEEENIALQNKAKNYSLPWTRIREKKEKKNKDGKMGSSERWGQVLK